MDALLSGIEISLINQEIIKDLFTRLIANNLIHSESPVGSDCEGGVCIRWPEHRLFCDVTGGEIYISVVPIGVTSLHDVKMQIFNHTEMDAVCKTLLSIICPTL